MPDTNQQEKKPGEHAGSEHEKKEPEGRPEAMGPAPGQEPRSMERGVAPQRGGLRGTAAMDPDTRKEVARKGGLAVSRNRQHMADIGRKGGQSVSKNREHMAKIGRKGGAASRGQRGGGTGTSGNA